MAPLPSPRHASSWCRVLARANREVARGHPVFAITRAGARSAACACSDLPGASLYVSPRWQAAAEPPPASRWPAWPKRSGTTLPRGDSLVVFGGGGRGRAADRAYPAG